MARVTVEDCIEKVSNRFELVLLASHRSRTISSGAPITVEKDNDKNPVIALREIAEGTISPEDIKEGLIHSMQKYVEVDEPEPEAAPIMTQERPQITSSLMLGPDDDDDTHIDKMTEDDLLQGIENLTPPETGNRSKRR